MYFSPRFLILFAVGLLFFALSGIAPVLGKIGFYYDLTLGALWLCDIFLTTARRKDIHVERTCANIFSIVSPSMVRLEVSNSSRWPVKLTLRDTPPHQFRADGKTQVMRLHAMSDSQAAYCVTPLERGDFSFADVHLRWEGMLGLAVHQGRVSQQLPVKAYPDLSSLTRFGVALGAARLALVGQRAAARLGEGTDFSRLREYVVGDDYRRLDWKASAKRGKLITREFQTERSQQIVIMIDTGRLMAARVGQLSKLDHVINAAWLLALSAVAKGDQVGLMLFGETVSAFLPPRRGKQQLARIVNLLYTAQPQYVEPNYAEALDFLQVKHKKRSLIVIFTDLLGVESAQPLLKRTAALVPHHLPLCITIRNTDLDREADMLPRRADDVYRKIAARELIEETSRTLDFLTSRGVLVVHAAAESLNTAVIEKYLAVKRAGRL